MATEELFIYFLVLFTQRYIFLLCPQIKVGQQQQRNEPRMLSERARPLRPS